MKKITLVIASVLLLVIAVKANAATTMVCQTVSGQQFVWVGNTCPPGSIFISY